MSDIQLPGFYAISTIRFSCSERMVQPALPHLRHEFSVAIEVS